MPDQSSEESIFKVVIENKGNEELMAEMLNMYRKNPLNQHCVGCFDTIRKLHDAGIVINNELESNV